MGIAKYFQRKARSAGKLVRMDRLRRSLRESFRRKKEHVPECSKPHQWQADEAAVRAGTCSFSVKYLGCVEVFESRGMQVCEEALKVLRNSRRRPVKGVLYVTGDGLRVVEDETKGLIVDQTIEKVSFCAPDRNHDKGFSYICRDGTTRRWMCHGFLAVRDSGERLSHAVGCAFAACLERKQKRDKECGVTMTFDPTNSSFTRTGSFRQTSLTERMQDPQECKPAGNWALTKEPPPVKPIHNPFAIERPHATPMMLQRQGSFRGFSQLGQSSPFKRQLSLRLNDLPSTLERQRSLSLESSDFSRQNGPEYFIELCQINPEQSDHSNYIVKMSPILESSPVVDKDTIGAMCQQVSQGLSLLSSTDDPFVRTSQSQPQFPPSGSQQNTNLAFQPNGPQPASQPFIQSNPQSNPAFVSGTQTFNHSHPFQSTSQTFGGGLQQQQQQPTFPLPPGGTNQAFTTSTCQTTFSTQTINQGPSQVIRRAPHLAHLRSQSLGEAPASSRTEPWTNGTSTDPFDAEWAALATRPPQPSTNPFQQSSIKAFEVQL